MNNSLKWITRTAIFLALLIAFQFVSKPLGTYVTGSLVNFVLVACVLLCGIWSGLSVAIISPWVAFFLGIGPMQIAITPAIMIGNMAIVLICFFICRKNLAINLGGAVVGAGVKALLLWYLVTKLILPTLIGLAPAAATKMAALFSYPQFITALIGGVLAVLVAPAVKRAMKL